ncbi:Uncharacterized protein FKW44_012667, partial [Caligus rogercresseyi]
TAIIVALRCGRAPKEIIDFFKFPKATVYSIAKSFKESEDIEEGFLTPERQTPDRSQVRKRSADFISCISELRLPNVNRYLELEALLPGVKKLNFAK